jgi:hypothetical protein
MLERLAPPRSTRLTDIAPPADLLTVDPME